MVRSSLEKKILHFHLFIYLLLEILLWKPPFKASHSALSLFIYLFLLLCRENSLSLASLAFTAGFELFSLLHYHHGVYERAAFRKFSVNFAINIFSPP